MKSLFLLCFSFSVVAKSQIGFTHINNIEMDRTLTEVESSRRVVNSEMLEVEIYQAIVSIFLMLKKERNED